MDIPTIQVKMFSLFWFLFFFCFDFVSRTQCTNELLSIGQSSTGESHRCVSFLRIFFGVHRRKGDRPSLVILRVAIKAITIITLIQSIYRAMSPRQGENKKAATKHAAIRSHLSSQRIYKS